MSLFELPGSIVSVAWLAANLNQSKLIIFDASMVREAEVQIPGARFFDFDKKICDRTSLLPHMMPTPHFFEQEVRALGVNQDSVIVIYDRVGVYSSPRAWWMLKAMGHDQVAVLDGGLPAWIKGGHPTQPVSQEFTSKGNFIARPRSALFCNADTVAAALEDKQFVVLDARSEGRFLGREPEPREGLRSGHMPHAQNLPFTVVQSLGHMLGAEELKTVFDSIVNEEQKLIMSCGSGVTACILALAAHIAGRNDISVYDGSWCEWGLLSSRPVTKGD